MLVKLAISCLAGIGALCCVATLLVIVLVLVRMRRMKQETPQQLGGATFTKKQAERIAALKYRYEQQTLNDDEIDRAQRNTW